MKRIRISLGRGNKVSYKYLAVLHEALVKAWTAAGTPEEEITGMHAKPWTFAPLGFRKHGMNHAHTLVVSTPSLALAESLMRIKPCEVCQRKVHTGETVDFTGATVSVEPDPVFPATESLAVLTLSPFLISGNNGSRWHNNLNDFDISSAVNERLSCLANREVELDIKPDDHYIRTNTKYDCLVRIKKNKQGKEVFAIGMRVPLVLSGRKEDLRFAWYCGIGEKTRTGFGCLGLAEDGIGRKES